jgi:hypothetical protein
MKRKKTSNKDDKAQLQEQSSKFSGTNPNTDWSSMEPQYFANFPRISKKIFKIKTVKDVDEKLLSIINDSTSIPYLSPTTQITPNIPTKVIDLTLDTPESNLEEKEYENFEYSDIEPYSPAWYYARTKSKRGNVPIYGSSSLGNILGLWTKYGRGLFDKPFYKEPFLDQNTEYHENKSFIDALFPKTGEDKDPIPEHTQTNFDWGHAKEENAILNALMFYDNFTYETCGSYLYSKEENLFDVFVTPDGILLDNESGCRFTFEAKAPCPFVFQEKEGKYAYRKRVPFKTRPHYYLQQLYFQMAAVNTQAGVFSSFTNAGSISITSFSNQKYVDLCCKCINWAVQTYVIDKKEVPKFGNVYVGCKYYKEFIRMTRELENSRETIIQEHPNLVRKFYKPNQPLFFDDIFKTSNTTTTIDNTKDDNNSFLSKEAKKSINFLFGENDNNNLLGSSIENFDFSDVGFNLSSPSNKEDIIVNKEEEEKKEEKEREIKRQKKDPISEFEKMIKFHFEDYQ